jgi:hypothetical protein
MREEYELKHGKRSPYADRLGKRGRAQLLRWWTSSNANIRVLPDDVAREFPDTRTTVQALRLVMKLRAVKPIPRPRKRRTGSR